MRLSLSVCCAVSSFLSTSVQIADHGAQTVVKLGSSGTGAVVTNYATSSPSLAYPDGLCLDPTGNVYVVSRQSKAPTARSSTRRLSNTTPQLLPPTMTSYLVSRSHLIPRPYVLLCFFHWSVLQVDGNNQRVVKFNNDGSSPTVVASTTTTNPPLNYPWNCAVDSAGQYLYISNTVGTYQGINKVSLIAPYNQAAFLNNTGGTPFRYPNQVAVDSSGNVYVSSTHSHTHTYHTARWRGHWTDHATAQPNQQPLLVLAAALTHSLTPLLRATVRCAMQVADSNNYHVTKMNAAGVQQQIFPTNTGSYPNGVAVDSNGGVYVTDTVNGVVLVYSAAGVNLFNLTTSNPPLRSPRGIWVDSNFNVYVADSGNVRIVKFYSSQSGFTGGFSGCSNPPAASPVNGYAVQQIFGLNNPYDVAIDGSNNIYVRTPPHHTTPQHSTAAHNRHTDGQDNAST